jgi:hypothetical protein
MTNLHTPCNTPWLVQSEFETTIVDSMNNELAQVFAPDTGERLEIARLMAAAPAQALLLDLVRHGLAPLTDGEVGFDEVVYAYDPYTPDWSALLDAIGWEKARRALANATPSSMPVPWNEFPMFGFRSIYRLAACRIRMIHHALCLTLANILCNR